MSLIEKIDSLYEDLLVRATHILAVGALTYPIHLIYRENPLYHMSGGLSFVIGRTLNYLSTTPPYRISK